MISTIAHWGNPEPPPISTTVNLNNCTSWALGMKVDLFTNTNDARNVKIHLGYYAASYMNLMNNEHISGESGIDSSLVTHHTYEVSLLPPGERLIYLSEEKPPSDESEGMMQRDEQRVANPIVFDDNETGNGEIGTLSLVTEQRIIKQAYLNNEIIPTQVDTCSLVSIVEYNDLRFNRILKIH